MFDACLLTLFIVLVMDVFITPTDLPWGFWVIEKNDANIGEKKWQQIKTQILYSTVAGKN